MSKKFYYIRLLSFLFSFCSVIAVERTFEITRFMEDKQVIDRGQGDALQFGPYCIQESRETLNILADTLFQQDENGKYDCSSFQTCQKSMKLKINNAEVLGTVSWVSYPSGVFRNMPEFKPNGILPMSSFKNHIEETVVKKVEEAKIIDPFMFQWQGKIDDKTIRIDLAYIFKLRFHTDNLFYKINSDSYNICLPYNDEYINPSLLTVVCRLPFKRTKFQDEGHFKVIQSRFNGTKIRYDIKNIIKSKKELRPDDQKFLKELNWQFPAPDIIEEENQYTGDLPLSKLIEMDESFDKKTWCIESSKMVSQADYYFSSYFYFENGEAYLAFLSEEIWKDVNSDTKHNVVVLRRTPYKLLSEGALSGRETDRCGFYQITRSERETLFVLSLYGNPEKSFLVNSGNAYPYAIIDLREFLQKQENFSSFPLYRIIENHIYFATYKVPIKVVFCLQQVKQDYKKQTNKQIKDLILSLGKDLNVTVEGDELDCGNCTSRNLEKISKAKIKRLSLHIKTSEPYFASQEIRDWLCHKSPEELNLTIGGNVGDLLLKYLRDFPKTNSISTSIPDTCPPEFWEILGSLMHLRSVESATFDLTLQMLANEKFNAIETKFSGIQHFKAVHIKEMTDHNPSLLSQASGFIKNSLKEGETEQNTDKKYAVRLLGLIERNAATIQKLDLSHSFCLRHVYKELTQVISSLNKLKDLIMADNIFGSQENVLSFIKGIQNLKSLSSIKLYVPEGHIRDFSDILVNLATIEKLESIDLEVEDKNKKHFLYSFKKDGEFFRLVDDAFPSPFSLTFSKENKGDVTLTYPKDMENEDFTLLRLSYYFSPLKKIIIPGREIKDFPTQTWINLMCTDSFERLEKEKVLLPKKVIEHTKFASFSEKIFNVQELSVPNIAGKSKEENERYGRSILNIMKGNKETLRVLDLSYSTCLQYVGGEIDTITQLTALTSLSLLGEIFNQESTLSLVNSLGGLSSLTFLKLFIPEHNTKDYSDILGTLAKHPYLKDLILQFKGGATYMSYHFRKDVKEPTQLNTLPFIKIKDLSLSFNVKKNKLVMALFYFNKQETDTGTFEDVFIPLLNFMTPLTSITINNGTSALPEITSQVWVKMMALPNLKKVCIEKVILPEEVIKCSKFPFFSGKILNVQELRVSSIASESKKENALYGENILNIMRGNKKSLRVLDLCHSESYRVSCLKAVYGKLDLLSQCHKLERLYIRGDMFSNAETVGLAKTLAELPNLTDVSMSMPCHLIWDFYTPEVLDNLAQIKSLKILNLHYLYWYADYREFSRNRIKEKRKQLNLNENISIFYS